MADKNELKMHIGDLPKGEIEHAVVNGVEYVRDLEGTWRYAASWIKVPGGRDLTLTERFNPKFVIANTSEGRQIERVVISGDEIEKHPDLLGWCMERGYTVFGAGAEEVFEVMVPFEIWHEHDRIPGELYAPEIYGNNPERELAEAERHYREADRALEAAAAKRAEVLRRHSEEMTRQQARAITDLSVGRIQQLIREGVELDGWDVILLGIVEREGPKNLTTFYEMARKSFDLPRVDSRLKRRVHNLREKGLIIKRANGFRLTPEGKEVLLNTPAGNHDLPTDEDD